MDKELKDSLTYVGGTIIGGITFISVIYQFTKDIHQIITYVILLILIIWVSYIQIKMPKKKEGKDDKK